MPVVKFITSDSPAQEGQRSQTAAAVMAVMLAKGSEPAKPLPAKPKRVKAERTSPRNPKSLTVDQHVFPSKSISRFTNQSGHVSVHVLRRSKVIRAKPGNAIFCASRAWDERAEAGYMKSIEDLFQQIVSPIADGKAETIRPEQKPAIDRMYALWYMRARYRELEAQEIQLNGIAGDDLTKEQEENLEKNGYMFARKGGTMPARQLNGLELQYRIDNFTRDMAVPTTRWGVIMAQSGEFIVPDVPSHGIIPITPRLAFVWSAPNGVILERNVAEINRAMRTTSQHYFFARDFSNCLFDCRLRAREEGRQNQDFRA
jgi:hypothetical protein